MCDAGATPIVINGIDSVTTICQFTNGTLSTIATEGSASLADAVDVGFLLTSAVFVFLMQAGFALLEAGSIRESGTLNVLLKNLADASIAGITFWLFGWAFAYGNENDGPFIGGADFALALTTTGYGDVSWVFQWAFAAASATIVAGSVAERTKFLAYIIYSVVITAFVYPVVVHWVWDAEGWLTAFRPDPIFNTNGGTEGDGGSNGMIDFAGSGVVHTVGGIAGLVGAIFIGPRKGRFSDDGRVNKMPGQNATFVALGVFTLWVGWMFFNAGSALVLSGGGAAIAAHAAVTTIIAPSAAVITAMIVTKILTGKYDVTTTFNAAIAGLVSITAGTASMQPWGALLTGIIGSCVFIAASKLLLFLKIDDPLDAFPAHGACGIWGVLAAGIFSTREQVLASYGYDNDAMPSGRQFAVQLVGIFAIVAWTAAMASIIFGVLSALDMLRISPEDEAIGIDIAEHGSAAYNSDMARGTDPGSPTARISSMVPLSTVPHAADKVSPGAPIAVDASGKASAGEP